MLININLDTLLLQEVNLPSFYYHIATFYSHLGFRKDIVTEVFQLAFAVTTEVFCQPGRFTVKVWREQGTELEQTRQGSKSLRPLPPFMPLTRPLGPLCLLQ